MLKLETKKKKYFHALSWASRARLRGYVNRLITIKQQNDAERSAREVNRVTTAMCCRAGRRIVISMWKTLSMLRSVREESGWESR